MSSGTKVALVALLVLMVVVWTAAVLLRKAAKIEKGSGEPKRIMVGTVTSSQVREIAEIKMIDLNAHDVESAMRIVAGTARSMGLDVEG